MGLWVTINGFVGHGVWEGAHRVWEWGVPMSSVLGLELELTLLQYTSFWWVTILGLVADGVWKVVYPQVFGRSGQLLVNKFLIRAFLL